MPDDPNIIVTFRRASKQARANQCQAFLRRWNFGMVTPLLSPFPV
jgi:hypothetical protein